MLTASMLKQYIPERRKNIRVPFWSIIKYRIVVNGQPRNDVDITYGNSLNLSVGGMCFETFEPMHEGTRLEITLALPMYPLRKILIHGEVLRSERINMTDLYTVALAFRNVSEQDCFAFAEFVEHYLK
jgi:c-di-GMP-binding flagellar brake protein YcgR